MKTVNIYEAKTNLSKLLELVQNGEEIVIAKAGKPIASVRPYKSDAIAKRKMAFGEFKGKLVYKDEDFVGIDSEVQEMFYGKDWDQ